VADRFDRRILSAVGGLIGAYLPNFIANSQDLVESIRLFLLYSLF